MLNDAAGFRKIYLAVGYTDLRRGMEVNGKSCAYDFTIISGIL